MFIELLRSYLEFGSLSYSSTLSGRFRLAHSFVRGGIYLELATHQRPLSAQSNPYRVQVDAFVQLPIFCPERPGRWMRPIELSMNRLSFDNMGGKT
jgi:hypothetical protein